MAIKTFDANRVGGGTFQLEQNPLTGEYQVKEVGFIKLPELKLPEIEQAAPTAVTPDDPTKDTAIDPGFNVSGQINTGRDGRDGQQDLTGAEMLKNIKTEATGGDLMEKATTLSDTLNRTDINQGAIQQEGLNEKTAYDKAVANYNAIAERNRELGMGRQVVSNEDRLQNKADLDAARNEMDAARENFEKTFETIKAAPVISEDLQKVEDISKPAQKISVPEKEKTKVSTTLGEKIDTALRGLRNLSLTGMLATIAQGTEEQQRLNEENSTALKKLGYKTNFELGISTDPGRIGGSAADNVFAGMNAQSAFGDIFGGAQKRIDTRNSAKTQERISKLSPERQEAFNAKTREFEQQLNTAKNQRDNDRADRDRGRTGGSDRQREAGPGFDRVSEAGSF